MTTTEDTKTGGDGAKLDPLKFVRGNQERPKLDTSQPILPEVLRSRGAFVTVVQRWARRKLYIAGKWLVHLPAIVWLLTVYSPRGLARLTVRLARWVYDMDSATLRHEHAASRDSPEFARVHAVRKSNLHARIMVLCTGLALTLGPLLAWTLPHVASALVGLGVFLWIVKLIPGRHPLEIPCAAGVGVAVWYFLPAGLALIPSPPGWALAVVLLAAVLTVGWFGRPAGKRLVTTPATLVDGSPGPLKAPFVMEALCSLGIGGMKNPSEIGLLFDVGRVGPGYQCDMELPRGVAAAAVIEKRSQLSAALRRELGTVWPAVGKRHEGHLVLYVSDQPMATARQARWPLLKDGKVNLFQPAPAFTDQRGRWVDICLAYTSGVIGAVPRMGKTFYLRELLLIAGLDPRCKVYAVDLKGTGDLAPTALFAHFYSCGDEDEEIDEQLAAMRALRQEMRRRAKVIRELPHERCPENKVTSELADDRSLGLEPIYLGVDECQVWFQHEDKDVAKEFTTICTDLVKRGPALGIMCYFATQKPSAKSIPTDIADNAVVRIALKVAGQVPNDQVLGTSSYQMGLRATLFDYSDKGVAYLKSDGADAQIVRSVVGLDAPESERVAARARQARQAGGWLTRMAAGDEMQSEADQVAFIDDVRQAFANYGNPGVLHLADLAAGVGELRPGVYGHLDNASLAKMLRAAGIKVDTVYDPQKDTGERVAKGVKAEWLDVSATSAIGEEAEEEQADLLTATG